ncbi:MAG: histidinol-phosphate transaminase [Succinivibrionaceae bacterium]
MDPIANLATTRVKNLTPYMSARRIGGRGHTFLNANEAPKSASYLLNSLSLNRYPECQPPEVLEAYASYAGVADEKVLVSRGSDESIGLLVRTFCESGKDAILICPPTYGMYSISADTAGVETIEIAPQDNFQPDVEQIKSVFESGKSVKVIFLCSPNNPTGTLLDQILLKEILEFTKDRCLVVVDEAYIEFCPEATAIGLLDQYRNLVITRTLSKAFALAGLRCGFTIADPEVIKMMLKVIDPYPISDPVAQIAIQALSKNGLAILKDRVKELNERKEKFINDIKNLSFVEEIFCDKANYILVRFKDGEEFFDTCVKKGIILRDFHTKPRLRNCVRITIGSDQEMAELTALMQSLA